MIQMISYNNDKQWWYMKVMIIVSIIISGGGGMQADNCKSWSSNNATNCKPTKERRNKQTNKQ